MIFKSLSLAVLTLSSAVSANQLGTQTSDFTKLVRDASIAHKQLGTAVNYNYAELSVGQYSDMGFGVAVSRLYSDKLVINLALDTQSYSSGNYESSYMALTSRVNYRFALGDKGDFLVGPVLGFDSYDSTITMPFFGEANYSDSGLIFGAHASYHRTFAEKFEVSLHTEYVSGSSSSISGVEFGAKGAYVINPQFTVGAEFTSLPFDSYLGLFGRYTF